MTNGNDELFGRYIEAGAFEKGVTKREMFAAMAMQGLLSKEWPHDEIADEAVAMADSLIDFLNVEKCSEPDSNSDRPASD